jgi:hypothetical protein
VRRIVRCGCGSSCLPGGDEERAGGVGADSETLDHLGRGLGDARCGERVEGTDLVVEFEDASGERLERHTIRAGDVGAPRGRNAAAVRRVSGLSARAVRVTGASLEITRWDAYDNGHSIVDLVPTCRFTLVSTAAGNVT